MNLIVWDTETTGLSPENDRLVEIAGIAVNSKGELVRSGGGFTKHFETYIDPQRSIPPEVKCIHHITEAMVVGAPTESAAVLQMIAELDITLEDIFIAHNAKFDRGFLKRISPDTDRGIRHICTMKCAQVIWPDAPSYKNQFLRYWLNLNPIVPEGLAPHRALYDIIVTAAIFERELEHLTLEQMIELSNKPVLLKKMPMGKHKGESFDKVPYAYLKWIVEQGDAMNEDIVFTAKYWLSKTRY